MCGFVGFTAVDFDRETNKAVVKDMADRIAHRGPDDEGFFVDDDIAMGFRRLSIIDLEGSRQPMQNADGTVTVTFNGEIYNFQELRAELEALGYAFVTNGDTETIVHGYEAWGTDVFEKLRGMFAIAIWDAPKKRLVCARDLFGIKPFYYQHDGNRLIYGSEIKAFLAHPAFRKELNREMLPQYLCFEYMNDSQTMFKDVHKLLPGHFMVFENGELNVECFYRITYKIDESKGLDEWADEINRVFDESVAAHEIADVEIGSFLSGGIDSSLAAYCMGQHAPDIKTFSVGYDIGCEDKLAEIDALPDFDIKLNELDDATAFAEWAQLPNWQVKVDAQEFLDIVPTEQYHMDEPLGAPSAIPLFFVSKLAREQVKVVQSGEGADELFGGYTIYNEPHVFKAYQKILPSKFRLWLAKEVKKLPHFKGQSFIIRGSRETEEKFIGNAFMYDDEDKRRILKDPSIVTRPQSLCKKFYDRVRGYDQETKMQYLDINLWMVGDILLKADRMSMANSLELRVPFLDKEVFKVASKLPTRLRVNKKNTKYAMRQAANRHLPQETAQKEKLGFPVPTRVWLRDEKYYNIVKEKFHSETAKKFFNTDVITQFLDDHYHNKDDNSRKVWTIYIFLVWYDIYFGDPNDVTPR